MRPETPGETLVLNTVWKMARHTVTVCCGRYRQCNAARICRQCMRLALEAEAEKQAAAGDDLSYYDNPQESTDAQVPV